MNMTKCELIKAGLRRSFQTGESGKASPVCYGYKVTSKGKLVAHSPQTIITFHIFADEDNLRKMAASLACMKVKSPTGKGLQTRETISKILSNEKYVGDMILGKTQVQNGVQVKMVDHTSQIVKNGYHEPIIDREIFDRVQEMKGRIKQIVQMEQIF